MATEYHKPKQGTSSEMVGEGILSHPVPNVQSLFNRQTLITSISEAAEIIVIFQRFFFIYFYKVKPQLTYT